LHVRLQHGLRLGLSLGGGRRPPGVVAADAAAAAGAPAWPDRRRLMLPSAADADADVDADAWTAVRATIAFAVRGGFRLFVVFGFWRGL